MQSESAPAAVAIRDVVTFDIANLGKDNLGKDSLGQDSLGKDSLGQDNLGQNNLGKDHDNGKDKATGFETGAISARCAKTFSSRSFISTLAGNLTGIEADFWAGEASIGRVDGIVDGAVLGIAVLGIDVLGIDDSTVAGGAKSSTTPITMDELYDGDTPPVLLWKRSMTRRRWRWFRSASDSWRKLRNVQRR